MSEFQMAFEGAQTIAVIGASPKTSRDSNSVSQYLQRAGFRVIPIRPPGGEEILGEQTYASITNVPDQIDLVSIFRNSEAALAAVEEVVRADPLPRAIWLQFGVVNEAAKALAESRGITVFMDHCIKVDHASYLASGSAS